VLHVRVNVPPIPAALEALAEGLVLLNVALFDEAERRGGEIPELYESNVVYRREPPGREWWETAIDAIGLASKRSGDCEDLASYRAAELRFYDGEPARVKIIRTRRGSFHAVVERGDGSIEDPSRIAVELERQRRHG